MTRNELIHLRNLLVCEKEKLLRINELLQDKNVIEYLRLKAIKENFLDINDEWSILQEILKNFEITQTNGIYVCIGTYFTDSIINYQDTTYYPKEVDFKSDIAEYRIYQDIENGVNVKAYLKEEFFGYPKILSTRFEQDNLVLNPYNTYKNNNGYEEVRKEFFVTSIQEGQKKAKRLILDKFCKI